MSELAYIGPGGRVRRPLLRTLIGDVLRRARTEQGRTLADVARAARVSLPYLSELERGRKEASSEVLAAVCDALRIDLADVLAEVLVTVGRTRRDRLDRLDQRRPDHDRRLDDDRPDATPVLRLGGQLTRAQRPSTTPRRPGDATLLAA
jgi:transcriptional regulator with XRE-family HTH domain